MELSVVVGNPKPSSRTRRVAEAVAERVAVATGASIARTVDICDYADHLFTWPHEELAALNEVHAASDVLVIASPTYKGAYTGLLKAFLDRYPHNGLAGVTAIPVMTGGNELHGMAVDTALRPLLVELGASVPTRGLFFFMERMGDLDEIVDKWARENLTQKAALGSALQVAS